VVEDADRLARGEEEPAAAEAHHRVPDKANRSGRDLELHEALPGREAVGGRRFDEVLRQRAQRLVEREGHVPRLTREDREDRRGLQAEQTAVEERDEAGDGDRQKAEDGDRLQDVEQRDQQALCVTVTRRGIAVRQREDERRGERDEHAQRRARRVVRQMARVEIDARERLRRRERDERASSDFRDQREEAERSEDDREVGESEREAPKRPGSGEEVLHRPGGGWSVIVGDPAYRLARTIEASLAAVLESVSSPWVLRLGVILSLSKDGRRARALCVRLAGTRPSRIVREGRSVSSRSRASCAPTRRKGPTSRTQSALAHGRDSVWPNGERPRQGAARFRCHAELVEAWATIVLRGPDASTSSA